MDRELNTAGYTELNRVRRELAEAKTEIDELVNMLEEAMEWNWLVDDVSMGHAADVSRSKGQALIAKHKVE